MLTLNEKSKEVIKKRTGLNVDEITRMDFGKIDEHIEKKTHHELHPMTCHDDKRLQGRGSVYLHMNRLIDVKTINKKLSRI